jgi:putative hemolysin
MTESLTEVAIILVLLLFNGVFAMAEIAVVSARKGRLRHLADEGNHSARAALDLAESPNRFLSTVQVGITLVGIVAGAFGGATLAARLAVPLAKVDFLAPYADKLAFFLVVAAITYFSLVLGELVPKRVGLGNPEGIAMAVARPMNWLSSVASPLVSFLVASTEGLLRLLGFKPSKRAAASEEEVRVLMQEGLRAGSFNRVESEIVHSALELDQLRVREIMTPKRKVVWLEQTDSHDRIWHKIVVSNHTHFPVYENDRDHVVGIVSLKAIYAHLAAGIPVVLKNLMTTPLVVPETQIVLQLVEIFKQTGRHIALVTDEFGDTVGLVTLNDVMEAVVGEFPPQGERGTPPAIKRQDGTWLLDGMLDPDAVERALPGFTFGDGPHTEYQTLAGFLVKRFGQVPKEGETLEIQGYVFEILDMDRHRVNKVLVLRAPTSDGNPATGPENRIDQQPE